ncbi:MAG TPA: polysaccharide deacetylase family protein [Chloroflexia bacterium]|nr:polysaccharide deacetylase family protein [Chloroflexia bacterium]
MLTPSCTRPPARSGRLRTVGGAGLRCLPGVLCLLLAGLCLLPAPRAQAAPAPQAVSVPEIARVAPGKGRVALTFDGDAFGGPIWEILATLRTYHVRATFFLTGHYLETFPVRSRAIAAAGHEIASHGYDHQDYRNLTDGAIARRLEWWTATYYNLTGNYGPPFWRAPYGYTDTRVRAVAAQEGYDTIYWTLDSLDTLGPPKSADFIFRRLTESGVTLDGAILLLHVNPVGTVDALPRVLENLQARGLDVVSVSGLLAP